MSHPRLSFGEHDFLKYFNNTMAGFEDDRKVSESPVMTLYDSMSNRSMSPLSTAGTAVEENGFDDWTFKGDAAGSDSEDSDSDDESEDGDVPPIDIYEERGVPACPPDQEVFKEQAQSMEEDAPVDDDDLRGEMLADNRQSDDTPYIPADYAHTSIPPSSASSTATVSWSTTQRRTTKASRKPRLAQDVDYESDNAPTEDEYHPSPPLNPKKRPSSSKKPTRSTKRQRLIAPAAQSNKRLRAPPPSRNKQATIRSLAALDNDDFKCNVCDWVQVNHRRPDFLRHLSTHLRPDEQDQTSGWWCKGVRVEHLDEFNQTAHAMGRKPISSDMTVHQFRDHERIGGCLTNFSRRDALKRHLDNPAMSCSGYACRAMEEG